MTRSKFAYSIEYQDAELLVDPIGSESLLDALIRTVSVHTGKTVKACVPVQQIGEKRAYSLFFEDGCSSAVLGTGKES